MDKEAILKELEFFNNITFVEDNHRYYIGDYAFPISSTTWVKQFKEPFNEDYWAGRKAKERGVTKEEILLEWEEKRKYSTDVLGTPFHRYMECELSGIENDVDTSNKDLRKLIDMADVFLENSKNVMIPVKSEVVLGDKDIGIAGMIDQLYINTTSNLLEMWDWKTSKEIKQESFGGRKMKHPFTEYNDANFFHYALQMNLYQYMIEKHTSLRIDRKRVAQFSILNNKYEIFTCPDMQFELNLYFKSLTQ